MKGTKEKALQRGPTSRIRGTVEAWGNIKDPGSGSTSDDSKAAHTIQSLVLGFLAGVFEAIGEATAKSMGWECSFSALEISEALGLHQRQVSNAIFRLKHRRHTVWYSILPGGKYYRFTIPEILFHRGSL